MHRVMLRSILCLPSFVKRATSASSERFHQNTNPRMRLVNCFDHLPHISARRSPSFCRTAAQRGRPRGGREDWSRLFEAPCGQPLARPRDVVSMRTPTGRSPSGDRPIAVRYRPVEKVRTSPAERPPAHLALSFCCIAIAVFQPSAPAS